MLIPSEAPPVYAELLFRAERDAYSTLPLARQVYQQTCQDDLPQAAWATYTLGWALLRRSCLSEADTFLRQAHTMFVSLGHTRMELHCCRALLINAMLEGANKQLQAEWHALVAAYEADESPLDAARTRLQQAAHLNILGHYADAHVLLNQITPILHTHGTLDDQARLFRVTALAASHTNNLEYALAQIDAATTCFTRLSYPLEVGKCYFEKGAMLERYEQYLPALASLEQAHAIFLELDDQLQLALCEKTLGLTHSRLGHFDQSLTLTLHAQGLFMQLERRDQTAACDLNIGNIAYYSGLYELALATYRRAQHIFDEIGIQHDSLIAQRNQAMVVRAQGRPAVALEQLFQLEQRAIKLQNEVELAKIYQVQAEVLRDLEQYSAAFERLERAQAVFLLKHSPIRAECLLDQGWLYLAQQNVTSAVRCFVTAQAELSHRPIHFWRIMYGLGKCAQLQGDPQAALAHYGTASALMANLRSLLISEHASSGFFIQARQLFIDAFTLAVQQQDLQAALSFAEQQYGLILQRQTIGVDKLHGSPQLQVLYEQQRAHLRTLLLQEPEAEVLDEAITTYMDVLLRIRHYGPIMDQKLQAPFDLQLLKAKLTEAYSTNWTALIYVETNDTITLIMLDAQDVRMTEIRLDARLLRLIEEACLPEYRRYTYLDLPRQFDSQRPPWQSLAVLAAQLIPEHVRERLHPEHRLLVVPNGSLHSVPWAALRINHTWLCECAIIQVIPRLSLWEALDVRRNTGTEALLIGCSYFQGRATPLPGVAIELDAVAARCPGDVTRLVETTATRSTILALAAAGDLARYRLIHIASHAQLTAAYGLLAHLKLWDDDLLYDEIVGLQLSGALIVLSTCEGSSSQVLPGEEVLSLSRAFLAAGALDVVASLWPTDDQSVVPLVTAFYDALFTGLDVPTALTYAQRHILSQCEKTQQLGPSPLAWAGFHALGSGSALNWTAAT
jgi:tetratricopeptide (TPR) repeat protein